MLVTGRTRDTVSPEEKSLSPFSFFTKGCVAFARQRVMESLLGGRGDAKSGGVDCKGPEVVDSRMVGPAFESR